MTQAVFPTVLGEAFAALPPAVQRLHGGRAVRFAGTAVSAGRGVGAMLGRWLLGLPRQGRHRIEVEISLAGDDELWTRQFSGRAFHSHLRALSARPGEFEERLGPAAFRFNVCVGASGFRFVPLGWRIGPLPMPRALAPTMRGRAFEVDGEYRFRALVAHPLLGVILAYAGRLTTSA